MQGRNDCSLLWFTIACPGRDMLLVLSCILNPRVVRPRMRVLPKGAMPLRAKSRKAMKSGGYLCSVLQKTHIKGDEDHGDGLQDHNGGD